MPPVPFTSSTPSASVLCWIAPNRAAGPVMGESTPTRISSFAWAQRPATAVPARAAADSNTDRRFLMVLSLRRGTSLPPSSVNTERHVQPAQGRRFCVIAGAEEDRGGGRLDDGGTLHDLVCAQIVKAENGNLTPPAEVD